MAGVPVGVGYIDIKPDLSGFGRELKTDMNRDLAVASASGGKTFGTNFLGSVKGVLGGLAAAGAVKGAFNFLGDAIDAASELNEVVSKSNNVFKSSAGEISAWATAGAKDFGLSERAALEAASGFGNMFAQLGIGLDLAATMSTSIVELAADFASFHNADISEVISAQSAAFRGEYDALQRFLPLINATTVEQQALAMTGKRATKELTAQEKALAVQALMLKGAGDAAGDFDRTSDSLANQTRIMNAEWENSTAILGEELLPVMTDLVGFLNSDGIPGFLKWSEILGEGFVDAAGFFIGAMADVMSVIAGALEKIDQFTPGMEGVPEDLREQVDAARELEAALHGAGFEFGGLADATDEAAISQTLFEKGVSAVTGEFKGQLPVLDLQTEAVRNADKAARDAASAQRDLGDAQKDLNKLLAQGAVDEEKVAAARQSLADATRSAASADRALADAQEDYDTAVAESQVLHGFDTAMEKVEDAADGLADAQDNAASAHERAAEAAKDLREAQAGDPDFQDKLADARDRVADATDRVAESNDKVTETSRAMESAVKAVGEALDGLAGKFQPLVDIHDRLVGGPLGHAAEVGELDPGFIDAYATFDPQTAAPRPFPFGGKQGLTNTPNNINNVTINVTQTDPDVQALAAATAWAISGGGP